MKTIMLISALCLLSACASPKSYESKIFPKGKWQPVNPEYFGQTEAQRILQGRIPK